MKKKIKLFCLPYAGGTAMVYTKWSKYLHKIIELYPLEMSGRGKRFGLQLFDNIEDTVDDLFKIMSKELDGSYYAIFGHSMGTLVIYELIRKIHQMEFSDPLHIFMSGRFPPHIRETKILHTLVDDRFKDEIIKLGGIPEEVIQNTEFFNIFMPILRADYKLIETYKYSGMDKWNFDISVFSGNNDPEVQEYDIRGWKNYTNKKCDFYEFNGGHFFINDDMIQVVQKINDILIEKNL
ncbi:surfactin synthase thioesterase subunit [Sporomusaceae bacterium BoRhaA]|uniref:thioesterase II family protein n=1 Tax=Pelorhabdus rhamnosifermentans TaxID=2772457 RepID=UPI001C060533|nr:thioesterase domain-containing protein [Pelorhabdus rhamnosifermentans]MBU2699295.1 surfactin synthase thioesterase subunit [Pelorhabdus rhamnosifermentans]